MDNYAIILAGGIGSRFWPLSRKSFPKQFLKVTEEGSFLRATIKRILPVFPVKNIYIVTNQLYLKQIKNQLNGFKIPEENIILEPKALNTLPAISLCAQLINHKNSQANLLVLPSDHYIKEKRKFNQIVLKALNLAKENYLCLIGIKPDSPSLGYGYIQAGKKIDEDIFYVKHFKEKPKFPKAKKLFRKRDIFWNSGIFCFRAEAILKEIKIYTPKLYHQIIKIHNKKDIKNIWPRIRPISIDYGLLEKSKNLVMITAQLSWRDIGSWDAFCKILPRDRDDNIFVSDALNLDSKNILVYAQKTGRLIATVGLKNLIIIDTADALLVCEKGKAQEIKKIVEILKKKRKKCI